MYESWGMGKHHARSPRRQFHGTCTATYSGSNTSGVCTANAYDGGGNGLLLGVVSNSTSVTFNYAATVTDINAICF